MNITVHTATITETDVSDGIHIKVFTDNNPERLCGDIASYFRHIAKEKDATIKYDEEKLLKDYKNGTIAKLQTTVTDDKETPYIISIQKTEISTEKTFIVLELYHDKENTETCVSFHPHAEDAHHKLKESRDALFDEGHINEPIRLPGMFTGKFHRIVSDEYDHIMIEGNEGNCFEAFFMEISF